MEIEKLFKELPAAVDQLPDEFICVGSELLVAPGIWKDEKVVYVLTKRSGGPSLHGNSLGNDYIERVPLKEYQKWRLKYYLLN